VRSSSVRAGLAQRARIVLLAADGASNTAIAGLIGVSRPTVIGWRERYRARGWLDWLMSQVLHRSSFTSVKDLNARSAPSSPAGTTAPTPSPGPKHPSASSAKPTVRTHQTHGTSHTYQIAASSNARTIRHICGSGSR
jgi:hypothetical protein